MQRLDILRQKVEELYTAKQPEADRWVDWGYKNHVLVVAELAEKIAKKHGGNVEFVVAGALLHDVADAVMARKRPEHEQKSLQMAENLLQQSGFSPKDTAFIVQEIIKPHSCNDELMPTTLEGKIVATADGAAHFTTDFYLVFCWRHYGPKDDYYVYKKWVLEKLEKNIGKKLFFEDVRQEVTPRYQALKALFS